MKFLLQSLMFVAVITSVGSIFADEEWYCPGAEYGPYYPSKDKAPCADAQLKAGLMSPPPPVLMQDQDV